MLALQKAEIPAPAPPVLTADEKAWQDTEILRLFEPAVGERPRFPSIPLRRIFRRAGAWREPAISLALWGGIL